VTRVSITKVGDSLDSAFALAMTRAECTGVIRKGDRVVIKPSNKLKDGAKIKITER